jgi:hypothetical protein
LYVTAVIEYGAGAVRRLPFASYVNEPVSASQVSAVAATASVTEVRRLLVAALE